MQSHHTPPGAFSTPGDPPRHVTRRIGVTFVGACLALVSQPLLAPSPAMGAVTIGENISAFPNRDMVVAVGYELGEELTVEVVRNGAVIGTATGPAVSTPEGIGLEVNHGPVGAPQPGDCWDLVTPDIVGGDEIRVTTARGVDSMTVADIDFTGTPTLVDGNVVVKGEARTATGAQIPASDIAVEFRRDKPQPRFRRGPFLPVYEGDTNVWAATFRPSAATSEEGLTTEQQRDIAINEASWAAVIDNITETTLAELGEAPGVAAGCTGTAEPNNVIGGLEPINTISGDMVLSGTARGTVAAVTITVGSLPARDVVLSEPNADGIKTWELTIPRSELLTLPDGNVTIGSRFDGAAGANRTVLKDTRLPAPPTATPPAGTYSTTQQVTLNKPAGEEAGKIYWLLGAANGPEPTVSSTLYTGQIAISATQTLKAILVDRAGNPSAAASFGYTIDAASSKPEAPTSVSAEPGDGAATVSWTPPANTGSSAITEWKIEVYRVTATGTPFVREVSIPTDNATSAEVGGLTNGTTYRFKVQAVNAQGVGTLSTFSNAVTPAGSAVVTRPGAPTIGTAVAGAASATVNWTAPTSTGGAPISEYRIQVRTASGLSRTVTGVPGTATSSTVTGLTNNTAYHFKVRAVNSAGVGDLSAASNTVTPRATTTATRPGAPVIGTAAAGASGGAITATARWAPPATDGGSAITGYRVRAQRLNAAGDVVGTSLSAVQSATRRSLSMTLPVRGARYRFQVQARNVAGSGNWSTASNIVVGR